jgi:acetyl-CoA synthetase
MRLANASPHGVRLRTIASGGETLGQELFEWGRQTFGLSVNEFYGQTECNLIACNSATIFPVRPGSFGRPVPGHQIRVVSDDGRDLRRGEVGNIAIRRGNDPVMFVNYWNDPATTNAKFKGDLLITGDLAYQDEDDYFWFIGRSDDIITSAGYRIGPGEIEDCLLKHPAVAIAAVAGVPDPIRTEIVKAWIVLRNGFAGSESLAVEIQEFVKVRLAAHEYPRQVVFVRQLPMTSTGKIIRNQLRIPS